MQGLKRTLWWGREGRIGGREGCKAHACAESYFMCKKTDARAEAYWVSVCRKGSRKG